MYVISPEQPFQADFEMKVTSEWKLDNFFRGYAAKMSEEYVI